MNSKWNILVLEEFSLLLSNVKIEELCLTLILHCVLYLPHEPDSEDCEVSGAEPGHLPHNTVIFTSTLAQRATILFATTCNVINFRVVVILSTGMDYINYCLTVLGRRINNTKIRHVTIKLHRTGRVFISARRVLWAVLCWSIEIILTWKYPPNCDDLSTMRSKISSWKQYTFVFLSSV